MSKERFIERQRDVRESAARLGEAVAQPESSLVRDAVIQRFEFTFEDARLLTVMAGRIQTLAWD